MQRPRGARRVGRDRRLRHRLLVARLPTDLPIGELKIDKSFVLARWAPTPATRCRALDDRARPQPRRCARSPRGSRTRSRSSACAARLRARPGLPHVQAAARRRAAALVGLPHAVRTPVARARRAPHSTSGGRAWPDAARHHRNRSGRQRAARRRSPARLATSGARDLGGAAGRGDPGRDHAVRRGSHALHVALHMTSYVLDAYFVFANRHLWLPLVALGAGLNVLAIAVNGGVMPASASALRIAGIDTSPASTTRPRWRTRTCFPRRCDPGAGALADRQRAERRRPDHLLRRADPPLPAARASRWAVRRSAADS